MPRGMKSLIALAVLGAGAIVAVPASAQGVGFGLSFNVPGLSVAVGTPAFAPAPVAAPLPAWGVSPVAPFRPAVRRWHRPFVPVVVPRPVVVRPPVVAVPMPVVVRPRPVLVAAPVARVAVPRVVVPAYGTF